LGKGVQLLALLALLALLQPHVQGQTGESRVQACSAST
jgi:hypothetical protein